MNPCAKPEFSIQIGDSSIPAKCLEKKLCKTRNGDKPDVSVGHCVDNTLNIHEGFWELSETEMYQMHYSQLM
ncbi:MAG: hypothetical protein ACLRZ5_08200 [Ruminococcus sp.]